MHLTLRLPHLVSGRDQLESSGAPLPGWSA
jgi:hypothetical protein